MNWHLCCRWPPHRWKPRACSYPLAAALNKDSGQYEWGPKALRVFEIEHPQPGGDVAAIKAGHVSVTPLDCGFAAGFHI